MPCEKDLCKSVLCREVVIQECPVQKNVLCREVVLHLHKSVLCKEVVLPEAYNQDICVHSQELLGQQKEGLSELSQQLQDQVAMTEEVTRRQGDMEDSNRQLQQTQLELVRNMGSSPKKFSLSPHF